MSETRISSMDELRRCMEPFSEEQQQMLQLYLTNNRDLLSVTRFAETAVSPEDLLRKLRGQELDLIQQKIEEQSGTPQRNRSGNNTQGVSGNQEVGENNNQANGRVVTSRTCYFEDYSPLETYPSDSVPAPTPHDFLVNSQTYVARLADELRHPVFLLTFVQYRENALGLLGQILNGCIGPELIAEVAAVSVMVAPRLAKDVLWLENGRLVSPVEKWKEIKRLWIELTAHSCPRVRETATRAVTCMISAEVFPRPS
ncbi:hypothetical protein IL306_012645 [Fusarium sp. DS 682]|nr:hypothetical protein IL306_012645 [Fusarium sp. DS 682]